MENWKRVSGILCDRRISLRVVRPAMMCGADTWAVTKAQEKKLDVAEMRMLRWMSGVTKLDRIRNERIKPGVHTNDFATIHGRPARIHTAPAESTVDSTYCLPQALCEYARGDRESWRNR